MTKLFQLLASYSFFVLIFNFSNPNVAVANTPDATSSPSFFDYISTTEVVEITLTTDLELLAANKKKNDYQEATISFTDQNAALQSFDLKVKPRGKFRRRVCDFVPLKLNFSKSDLAKAGLKDFDKMKLVTHCLDDKALSKEVVMREYLAYKLYNELTNNSLRVQLIKITYQDSKSKAKIKNRWGFLIEGTKELSERLNATEYEKMNVTDEQLVASSESNTAFFQYMIGNADWDVKMLRNVKLLENQKTGKITVIPYDFDFSGLVDATYAIPNPDYGLTSIKQRYFLGQKLGKEQWNQTVDLFQRKRVELINLVLNFKHLRKASKEEIINYLDEFYSELEAKQLEAEKTNWENSETSSQEEGSKLPSRPTFK